MLARRKPVAARKPHADRWSFLSRHAHVLLILAGHDEIRLREVAELVELTERAVQRIVSELVSSGYLTRRREGRCNRYRIHGDLPMRHALESHQDLAALLKLMRRRDGAPIVRRPADSGPSAS